MRSGAQYFGVIIRDGGEGLPMLFSSLEHVASFTYRTRPRYVEVIGTRVKSSEKCRRFYPAVHVEMSL
jgi:hypothetical protein